MDTTKEDDDLLLRATLLESLSYHTKMAVELQENINITDAVDEFEATNPKDVAMAEVEVGVSAGVHDPQPSTSKGKGKGRGKGASSRGRGRGIPPTKGKATPPGRGRASPRGGATVRTARVHQNRRTLEASPSTSGSSTKSVDKVVNVHNFFINIPVDTRHGRTCRCVTCQQPSPDRQMSDCSCENCEGEPRPKKRCRFKTSSYEGPFKAKGLQHRKRKRQ